MVHAKELKRTTNTGRLAVEALPNSEMKVRGLIDSPIDLSLALHESYHSLLLFPSEDAVELTTEFVQTIKRPVLLIVPDGNWRQACKVHHRHVEFKNIQCVFINKKNTSTDFLRKETKDNGMATLEAIAYALGVIEGEKIRTSLLQLYQIKLKQTLKGRGQDAKT